MNMHNMASADNKHVGVKEQKQPDQPPGRL